MICMWPTKTCNWLPLGITTWITNLFWVFSSKVVIVHMDNVEYFQRVISKRFSLQIRFFSPFHETVVKCIRWLIHELRAHLVLNIWMGLFDYCCMHFCECFGYGTVRAIPETTRWHSLIVLCGGYHAHWDLLDISHSGFLSLLAHLHTHTHPNRSS